jgi:hypothetical protein
LAPAGSRSSTLATITLRVVSEVHYWRPRERIEKESDSLRGLYSVKLSLCVSIDFIPFVRSSVPVDHFLLSSIVLLLSLGKPRLHASNPHLVQKASKKVAYNFASPLGF